MDALTALTTRSSVPSLQEPGPTQAQLEQLLRAAIRAPDHGLLRPWRFLILEGEQREVIGDLMVEELLRTQPDADERAQSVARSKGLRAPTVIVAVAEITEGHKVPAWEQVMAVGAAVENMMIAAHAMGVGAMWRTGAIANSVEVNKRLGFAEKDQIVAYLYLGTPAGGPKAIPEESPQSYIRQLP